MDSAGCRLFLVLDALCSVNVLLKKVSPYLIRAKMVSKKNIKAWSMKEKKIKERGMVNMQAGHLKVLIFSALIPLKNAQVQLI